MTADVPAGAGATAERDVVVDARGTRCPEPVIRLAAAARRAATGAVLELWATDPATRHDAPAWARMRGHELVALLTDDDGVLVVRVRTAEA